MSDDFRISIHYSCASSSKRYCVVIYDPTATVLAGRIDVLAVHRSSHHFSRFLFFKRM
jgi:hypothetical protein